MESRKRKSAMENYIDGLTDPPEKQRKTTEFYNSLRQFYKRRWNAPLRLPNVQGVEVNLYRLYDNVMALGGWQKVAAADRWSDIADMMGCKEDVVCGDHAIKLLYMRYLSKFEQVQTVGDVDDYIDNEMSRTRGRGATSFFATNECPISHSRLQEYFLRDDRGNIINEPDYSRLTKSLLSGLPNEVDFAVNICMLLSHSGPRQLRICHAPTLLTLLVAHTGVFDDNDQSLADLKDTWKNTTSHNFGVFWMTSGVPEDILKQFLGEDVAKYASEDDGMFSSSVSSSDVKDTRLWRCNQIATIIRNLTFEPINRVTIVKTWPVMKFLILCANCRWAALFTAAYDALSNLATDIDLTDRTLVHISHHSVLKIVQDGIFSMDKFKLVRSLEMLTGLCAYEGNEVTICDWLKPATLAHIFEIVGIKDIMMCVYLLECLYQISEMGDAACDMISDLPRAIQQLISMATLEAVSFGPAGLSGMKVVEYQPQFVQQANQNHAQPPHIQAIHPSHQQQVQQQQQQHPQQQQFVPPPPVPQQRMQPQPPMPPPMTVRQVIQCGLQHQHAQMRAQQQQQQLQQQQQQHHQIQQHANHSDGTPAGYHPSPAAHHGHHGKSGQLGAPIMVQPIVPNANSGDCEIEQLTEKWIKQNCVFEPTMSTPRGELYAAYVDDLRNQYHSLSGSLAMFSGVIKNLYPEVIFRMAENGVMIVAQGIRQVRPHRLAPAASSNTSPSTSVTLPQEKKAEMSHPLMQKLLFGESPACNGVNGHASGTIKAENETVAVVIEKKVNGNCAESNGNGKILTNGHGKLEICQDPIPASELFSEAEMADENEVEAEKFEKPNGKLTNGFAKSVSSDGRKKASVASRAAMVVAAAQKLNGINGDINGDLKQLDCDATTSSSCPSDSASAVPRKIVPTSSVKTDYMCDWDCCSLYYIAPSHVLKHLSEEHVVEELRLLCRWNGCSDPTPRNRWSLITHIQDMHCNETQLRNASMKRATQGVVHIPRPIQRTEIIPRDISNHPGYAKNAAMDAIKRHAFNFMSRDLTDEPEGPVTKSIRLTSCLILRNLARYSSEGRQKLRRHESHLCWLALSRLESSFALTQLLSELNQIPVTEEEAKGGELSTVPSNASLSSLTSTTNVNLPESPTKTPSSTPRAAPMQTPKPEFKGNSHRSLDFSVMPHTSMPRHHSLHQHLPAQPSPLVQTTPVRAGAGR